MNNSTDYSTATAQRQIDELRNRYKIAQEAYNTYKVSKNAFYRYVYFLRYSEDYTTAKIAQFTQLTRQRIDQILLIVKTDLRGVKNK